MRVWRNLQAALVLGTSGEIRIGGSPITRTNFKIWAYKRIANIAYPVTVRKLGAEPARPAKIFLT